MHHSTPIRRVLAAAPVLLLASAAWAQSPEAAPPAALSAPAAQDWTIKIEPSAWFASPGGKVRMPGAAGQFETRLEDLNLDSPRVSPFLEVHLRTGDWTITASGAVISLDDRGQTARATGGIGSLPYAAGDRIKANLDYITAELTAAHPVTLPESLAGKPGSNIRARLDILGGLRLHHYDLRFDVGGASTSNEEFFLAPLIGAKLTLDVVEHFTIDLKLDVSGFTDGKDRTSFGGDILAGFSYRPTRNLGVQIGYRFLINHVESGSGDQEFRLRGGMAGLYGGITLQF